MRSASSAGSVARAGAKTGMRARLRGRPLAAVVPIGIGHNNGPPMATRWGLHCWKRAQAKAWQAPSPEVVRLRMRRAGELGLSYRQLASIVMEVGRVPTALVVRLGDFPDPGLGERLRLPPGPRLLAVAVDRDGRADDRIRRLQDASGGRIDAWRAAADAAGLVEAVRGLLADQGVAPPSALMIGAAEDDRACAVALRLAGFLDARAYRGVAPHDEPATGHLR